MNEYLIIKNFFTKYPIRNIIIFFFISFLTPIAYSASFEKDATYQVCFTPGENCTEAIVNNIAKAQKEIRVMAYSFTSPAIAKALVRAVQQGIDVKVILDKSQKNARYTSATYLFNQGVPVFIDYKPAIAHNKVMIIDRHMAITGSFNFTKAAQMRNAENLLIIKDKFLATTYLDNWDKRYSQSIAYAKMIHHRRFHRKS